MRKSENLTEVQSATALKARVMLNSKLGNAATVEYIKRDGSASSLSGEVVEIVGEGDKEIVRVLTEKGYRSANLYNVTKVIA